VREASKAVIAKRVSSCHIDCDAIWADNDDFLAFTEQGERERLDFD
jgi:hypothetical protein